MRTFRRSPCVGSIGWLRRRFRVGVGVLGGVALLTFVYLKITMGKFSRCSVDGAALGIS